MKKVLFAAPRNISGGAERVMTTLANEFADMGYDTVFVNFDRDSQFYPLNEKVRVIKQGIEFSRENKLYKLVMSPVIELRRYLSAKRIIDAERPDAVVAFLKTAEVIFGLAALRTKTPFVTSIRNEYTIYGGIWKLFRSFAYPRIRAVVCQTEAVKAALDGDMKCRSVVIPNPVSAEAVNPNSFIGKPRSRKVIAVGRLCQQKNFSLFIKAVDELLRRRPDFRDNSFTIYGEGEQENRLKNEITALGLQDSITLGGVVPNVLSAENDAALYVMTSDYEGFPNTLAEAMANGIPAISTDFPSGAARSLIGKNERGWLVPVGGVSEVSQAMEEALSDSREADRRAEAALESVRQYNKEEIAKMWERVIFNG